MLFRPIILLLAALLVQVLEAQTAPEENPLFKKALKLHSKGNYEASQHNLKLLYDQGEVHPEYLRLNVKNLLASGNVKEAMGLLNTSIQRFPKSLCLVEYKGSLLHSAKAFEEAIKVWTLAMEMANTDSLLAEYQIRRGISHLYNGQVNLAETDLMHVWAKDSSSYDLRASVVLLDFRKGNKERALRLLNGCYEEKPNDFTTLNNIGLLLQMDGDYPNSSIWLERSIKAKPKEAFAWSNQSYNYLKLGDLKKAAKYINKSLKLDPSNSWGYKNRGLIKLAEGDTEGACKDFVLALDLGYTKQYGEEVKTLKMEHCP